MKAEDVLKVALSEKTLLAVGLVVGAFAMRGALDAHKKASDALAPVSNAIGSAWASVSMAVRGSHPVGFASSGFYLNDRYIDENFKVAAYWVDSIKGTHPDHPAMLNELLDGMGRVKAAYRALIGTEITKENLGL